MPNASRIISQRGGPKAAAIGRSSDAGVRWSLESTHFLNLDPTMLAVHAKRSSVLVEREY